MRPPKKILRRRISSHPGIRLTLCSPDTMHFIALWLFGISFLGDRYALAKKLPFLLCFYNNDASERGVTRAVYDYAHYAEIYLPNVKSRIILPLTMNSSNPLSDGLGPETETLSKYSAMLQRETRISRRKFLPEFSKRFEVSFCGEAYSEDLVRRLAEDILALKVQGGQSATMEYACSDLTTFALALGCGAVYIQKGGLMNHPPRYPDSFSGSIPTIVHAVFNWEPHGTVYGAISDSMRGYSRKYQGNIVPYIVTPPPTFKVQSFRARFEIRETALVVCRHGGESTFDISYARKALRMAIQKFNQSQIHFVFLGTTSFKKWLVDSCSKDESEKVIQTSNQRQACLSAVNSQVHFIPTTVDERVRESYFATCDVMLHARADGETFGLAVAEFSVRNKPVLTNRPRGARQSPAHLRALGDQALLYSSEGDIMSWLEKFIHSGLPKGNFTAFRRYYPEQVMKIFKTTFFDIVAPLAGKSGIQNRTAIWGR